MSDVLIVGGGVVGLSLGVELAESGARVTCVERHVPGWGCSAASLGVIYPVNPLTSSTRLVELSRDAAKMYPRYVSELEGRSGVAIGWMEPGLLEVTTDSSRLEALRQLSTAYCDAGIPTRILDRAEVANMEPALSPAVTAGMLVAGAAHVFARDLLDALHARFAMLGGELVQGFDASELLVSGRRCVGVSGSGRDVRASTTVLCNGAWMHQIRGLGDLNGWRVRPIRGQVIVLRAQGRYAHGRPPPLIYTDDLDVVRRPDGVVLVGSTFESAGFSRHNTVAAVARLAGQLQQVLTGCESWEFVDAWSGLRAEGNDGHPFVGKHPHVDALLISNGHNRSGLVLGPLFARLLARAIDGGGQVDPRLGYFGPNRIHA